MTKAKIYYRDIGDYLSREEKLEIIRKVGAVDNVDMQWQTLSPNEHSDWINHRNDKFSEFISLAPEKKFDAKTKAIFTTYSLGVNTSRDAWVYSFSLKNLKTQIATLINYFNLQLEDYKTAVLKNPNLEVDKFIDTDKHKISWSVNLKKYLEKQISLNKSGEVLKGAYRPFSSQYLYFDKYLIERPGLNQIFFPKSDVTNLIICVSCVGVTNGLSVLMADTISNLHFNGDTQCFPLYWYEETKQEKTLFDNLSEPENEFYARRDAISDFALNQARKQYGAKTTKEDIFYYVYGFLHNPDYRTEFAADLKKMLPRIPFVDDSTVFWKYVKAGRELAQLHLHYEDYENEAAGVTVNINNAVYDNFEVTKMRFASKEDKSTIIYNPFITLTGIPTEAYEYVVNGRSAIEWIMESYQIKTHKESGIVNNPNDWAREHNKPRYILDLLLSVIVVSVRTVEIVKGLPKIEL
jgi:predicted helicase